MSIYSKNSGSVSQIAKTMKTTYYEKDGSVSIKSSPTEIYSINVGYSGELICYVQVLYPANYDQRQFLTLNRAGVEIARSDGKDKIGGIGPCQNLCTVISVSAGQKIHAAGLVSGGFNNVNVNYRFRAILFHY